MPVVDRDDPAKLLGILKRGDVMSYYNRRLVGKMAEKGGE